MLTPQQKRHFEVFGFLALRGLFDESEMAIITQEAHEVFLEERNGQPFAGTERQKVGNMFPMRPFLDRVVDDDRIHGIACGLLGSDYILDSTEGNVFAEDTQWHGGDGRFRILRSIKIGIYLEPLKANSGCLRVMPGSHVPPFVDALKPLKKQFVDQSFRPFALNGPELLGHVIETQPGDVLVFPEELFHASFHGKPGRVQLAINFAANPVTQRQIDFVKGLYNRPGNTAFRPPRSYIDSDRTRLRRMVSRLRELGFEPL